MAKRILVLSDSIGSGNVELGRTLMGNFLHTLARSDTKPSAVMFANGGVHLVCEGSDVLDDLRLLENAGVMVRACGTCLDHFGIRDSVEVGGVGTTAEMVGALLAEDEIVTIA